MQYTKIVLVTTLRICFWALEINTLKLLAQIPAPANRHNIYERNKDKAPSFFPFSHALVTNLWETLTFHPSNLMGIHILSYPYHVFLWLLTKVLSMFSSGISKNHALFFLPNEKTSLRHWGNQNWNNSSIRKTIIFIFYINTSRGWYGFYTHCNFKKAQLQKEGEPLFVPGSENTRKPHTFLLQLNAGASLGK